MPNDTTQETAAQQAAETASTTAQQPDPAEAEKKAKEITRRGLQRLGYVFAASEEAPAAAATTETQSTTETQANEQSTATEAATETQAQTSEQAAAEATQAAADQQAAGTEQVAAAETQPVKKVRKVQRAEQPQPVTREELKELIERIGQPKTETAQPQQQQTQEPQLPAPDREEFEFARYAAQAEPEKYKDLPEKFVAFVRARDEFVAQQIKENGEFDPNSDEFKQFVERNRPTFQRGDRKRLEVQRIKDEAKAEFRGEFEKEKRALERKVMAIEATPVIQQAARAVVDAVLAIEDDAVKAFKADPKKALDENPLEAPIIAQTVREAGEMAEEYLKLSRGLADPDLEKNPTHQRLDAFIAHQGKLLDAEPEAKRTMPDGKILVSPARMAEMVAKKNPLASRYTTFTDEQIVAMIQEGGKNKITHQLQNTRKLVEKAGFVRKQAAAPTQQQTQQAAAAAQTSAQQAAPAQQQSAPKAVASVKAAPPASASKGGTPSHMKALGFR